MNPDSAALSGRQPKAVRNALAVLEEVVAAGPGVTAKEISAALKLPPATTYRLLNLLVAKGYLVRLPDLRGFALGRR
ncbi:MAG TPA: helix-turn-helix domain-containing protein, partial [Amycolatopsis sp.]|uniref:helix-turn-helix domain-containing protein n=1 Tax=Amycolatopsis sp. TaxID=37632 RepID=UPI002B498B4B